MIKAEIKGKYSTFVIPVKDEAYSNFSGWMWDESSARLYVKWKGPYDTQPRYTLYFGWSRGGFPDCCGLGTVFGFTSMIYGTFFSGLKDPNTKAPVLDDIFRESYEPWYQEAVNPTSTPAIGVVPANLNADGTITERSEFYKFLKTKGKFLCRTLNPLYRNSVLDTYLFAHPANRNLKIEMKDDALYVME